MVKRILDRDKITEVRYRDLFHQTYGSGIGGSVKQKDWVVKTFLLTKDGRPTTIEITYSQKAKGIDAYIEELLKKKLPSDRIVILGESTFKEKLSPEEQKLYTIHIPESKKEEEKKEEEEEQKEEEEEKEKTKEETEEEIQQNMEDRQAYVLKTTNDYVSLLEKKKIKEAKKFLESIDDENLKRQLKEIKLEPRPSSPAENYFKTPSASSSSSSSSSSSGTPGSLGELADELLGIPPVRPLQMKMKTKFPTDIDQRYRDIPTFAEQFKSDFDRYSDFSRIKKYFMRVYI